jgi:hypothetical protein
MPALRRAMSKPFDPSFVKTCFIENHVKLLYGKRGFNKSN